MEMATKMIPVTTSFRIFFADRFRAERSADSDSLGVRGSGDSCSKSFLGVAGAGRLPRKTSNWLNVSSASAPISVA